MEDATNYNYDYAKLKGKIKEVFVTQENFANTLGIGRTSLSFRLNNKQEFSQNEIKKSIDILKLNDIDIPVYFFKLKV